MQRILHSLCTFLLAGALLIGCAAGARADDDDARDQERARQALIEGRIRPLTEITELFRRQMAGEILGVELDVEGANTFVYEFKILTPQGKLKEVDVDAKTGGILKVEDD